MPIVSINDIIIPEDRQRTELDSDHIQNLAEDIAIGQLLHPIVLRSPADLTLVAGECRLNAVTVLSELCKGYRHNDGEVSPGYIPVTYLGDLSEEEYIEAELSENLHRQNLTWQEEAAAKAKLHKLRVTQKGTYEEPLLPEVKGQSLTDTATELAGKPVTGYQVKKLREDIELMELMEEYEEVAKAKTKKEAIKIANKIEQKSQRAIAALDMTLDIDAHNLILGDALVEVPLLPSSTFDMIMCDPPYGVNMHKLHGVNHDYDDGEESALDLIEALAPQWYRVAKKSAGLLMFCDWRHFMKLKAMLTEAGWWVWQRPLIWYKGNIGAFPEGSRGYRKTYECCLYASKGEMEFVTVQHDVFCVNQIQGNEHAAGKPPMLYYDMLKELVVPGNEILDSFLGSGSILPAAKELGCQVTGIELNEDYYNMAVLRTTENLLSNESF